MIFNAIPTFFTIQTIFSGIAFLRPLFLMHSRQSTLTAEATVLLTLISRVPDGLLQ